MDLPLFPKLAALSKVYAGANCGHITVRNPATAEVLLEVSSVGEAGAAAAIDAASTAFSKWKGVPADERSAALNAVALKMTERKEELAKILTLEQGKPLAEARGEILYAANYFQWYAEEARRVYGSIHRLENGKKIIVQKEPVGVCAAITPWNFPSAMIARKVGAAVAAGCSVIVKPSSKTPLSAFAIMELFAELNQLPRGLVSVICGDSQEISTALADDNRVHKISFTGSTTVGKELMRLNARTLKRLTLELGGNAPFIVFEDADIDRAVSGAIAAKFRNAGQTCIAVNRFLVHQPIEAEFTTRLVRKVKALSVGDGIIEGTDIGPLISTDAVKKVQTLLKDAAAKGAEFLLGDLPDCSSLFVKPVILRKISSDMELNCEEIFGPVCAISTFESESEAVQKANATVYGLASYIYTNNLDRAWRVSDQLSFGMVGLNEAKISQVQAPFGGIKESGFGREGGREGIEEYLNLKYIMMNSSQ